MLKRFFLANGTLGEVVGDAEDDDWSVFDCMNGAWRGEIRKDGKEIYVYKTRDMFSTVVEWTGDELPCKGDYNTIIPFIRDLIA